MSRDTDLVAVLCRPGKKIHNTLHELRDPPDICREGLLPDMRQCSGERAEQACPPEPSRLLNPCKMLVNILKTETCVYRSERWT